MKIGGLIKCSLIDYPGKVAAVIFTQGCNLRCRYCYNSELVIPEKFQQSIDEEFIFRFLQKRRKQLEGIVVSGGEPTVQKNLLGFLQKIKDLGFFVKLDTNGTNPFVLKKVLTKKLVDFVAMDVKASFDNYSNVVGVPVNVEHIRQSIDLIKRFQIPHQFRTTWVDALHEKNELSEILKCIGDDSSHVLQHFQPNDKVLDRSLNDVVGVR